MTSDSKQALHSLPGGVWQKLLQHAFTLIDEISRHGGISNPTWTFGGGTVLMLRHQHRMSKDIDIFVPDPQYPMAFLHTVLDVALRREPVSI